MPKPHPADVSRESHAVLGGHIKIHMPFEWCWGIVVAIVPDGRVLVRVDNLLTRDDCHGYDLGDLVTFERDTDGIWELADLSRQLPTCMQLVDQD